MTERLNPNIEAVKGLQGQWHLTYGEFDSTGNKLTTLCGTSISPNFRRFGKSVLKMKLCKDCQRRYNSLVCLAKAIEHG